LNAVGYTKLINAYDLRVIPNWHESVIVNGPGSRTETDDGHVRESFPSVYDPGDELGGQLEFTLKYDGTNLLILSSLFAVVPREVITQYVTGTPTGKYARRIWYLYELLTGTRLPIADLSQGNYVDLLDPQDYFVAHGTLVQRQRIGDNLLGDRNFCPMIRRTERLWKFEQSDLAQRCRQIIGNYPAELLRRAMAYLYTKESKSSFEIEHITPSANRVERFVALLQVAETEDFFHKSALIDVQNRIMDQRFHDHDYRSTQNYVGETISPIRQRVHFVSPKPGDLASLMDGMFVAHQRIGANDVHPVIHAAVIGYGFVFMHPFEDGNGRIHRFLIHNVLARREFTPRGIIFPASAVMLKRRNEYDASLEAFSKPLMSLVDYSLDEQGRMTVHNDTAHYYRYIDLTAQAEALFDFIRDTIEVELVDELHFLMNYDSTKHAIQEIVDIPDRLINLFIRCCLQNHGRLSSRKREEFFSMLSDQEVEMIERGLQQVYKLI
jgi:hypothetical protein